MREKLKNEYLISDSIFYKKLMGKNYINNQNTNKKIYLYLCGKIEIEKDVESFLILIQEPGIVDNLNNSLFLFNTKNGNLCSIVSLSMAISGIDRGVYSRTYFMDKSFTLIDYTYIDNDISEYIPKKALSDLTKKDNYYSLVYLYSFFRINQDGFIEFINK